MKSPDDITYEDVEAAVNWLKVVLDIQDNKELEERIVQVLIEKGIGKREVNQLKKRGRLILFLLEKESEEKREATDPQARK